MNEYFKDALDETIGRFKEIMVITTLVFMVISFVIFVSPADIHFIYAVIGYVSVGVFSFLVMLPGTFSEAKEKKRRAEEKRKRIYKVDN